MRELYEKQSIEIDSGDNFILQDIIKYNDLKSLTLNNIKIDDYSIIKELFDNLNLINIDILDCKFIINGFYILIKRVANNIELHISRGYSSNIGEFLINLPNCIDYIYIDYSIQSIVDGCFTNLPFGLKKIEIGHREYTSIVNNDLIKTIEKKGNFNYLFGAKIPFGCEMIVKITTNDKEIKYKVIYENNLDDELTFISDSADELFIIKKIIIKKIDPTIDIYDTNYNVLRIMSGMGGLGYIS